MNVYGRVVRLVLVAVTLLIGVAACGGGSGTSASPTSSTAPSDAPGSATISAFDVPRNVTCGAQPSTTVTVKYATAGAARQEVIVDGRPVPGTDRARGQVDAPVHCDPLEHTVVLVAYDGEGRRTTDKRFLHTDMPGASS
jgi:hypothetical protein